RIRASRTQPGFSRQSRVRTLSGDLDESSSGEMHLVGGGWFAKEGNDGGDLLRREGFAEGGGHEGDVAQGGKARAFAQEGPLAQSLHPQDDAGGRIGRGD